MFGCDDEVQFDTPVATYDKPASLFVSEFIGTTNRLSARVLSQQGRQLELLLPFASVLEIETDKTFTPGSEIVLSIRPEQICLFETPAPQRWPVSRQISVPIGPNEMIELKTPDGGILKLLQPRRPESDAMPEQLWCSISAEAQPHLFLQ